MKKTYRVGVIGHTGRGNYGHGLDTVWRDIPEAAVVAVSDPDPSGREQAVRRTGAERGYADYREMLDKERLDIVAIAPRWIDQHRDMALACAEHGCHIYMEKPFCRTLEEADEIVQACQMRHVRLAIAHQTRHSPLIPVVKQILQDGVLGDVLELRARGKEDHRGGGEDLWVLGTHLMDLMRVLAGDPVACFATVSAAGHPVTAADVAEGNEGLGPLAGDRVEAAYRFDSGVTGYFASRRNMRGNPSRFGLQIYGSKGVLEILTGYLPAVHILLDSSWSPGRSGAKWVRVTSQGIGKPEPLKDGGLHAGNVRAVRELIAAIENHREPPGNVEDARAATEMILAVFESHRLGKPVALPLENRKHPLTLLR